MKNAYPFLFCMPAFVSSETTKVFDGVTDDLLTAGLGKEGLTKQNPPLSEPPTSAELRRRAIYTNYRGLVDTAPGGGYGLLFGPGVAADGKPFAGDGKIAGEEWLAFGDDGSGRSNVSLMVQIPVDFDLDHPCIVTAPSSGSRGIYGAIGTAGEWGLKHRCAVAYTDKGTGTGAHDLSADRVNLIDGRWVAADAAGRDAIFRAHISEEERLAPRLKDRFAFKHAHSQCNPEVDWGRHVLWAVEYAFYVLNRKFARCNGEGHILEPVCTPANTRVIASSVSNGGAASLSAAELDGGRLISAVVVCEPNVNPIKSEAFTIQQGARPPLAEHSRSLFDYLSLLNVYQGAASLARANSGAEHVAEGSAERCASLHAKGLLKSTSLDEQATEAQALINAYGILPEQNLLQPAHWWAYVPQSITVTYAHAYARLGAADRRLGYGFGATAAGAQGQPGTPVALDPPLAMALFGNSNGIPPAAGLSLINELDPDGPREDRLSASPSSRRHDQNLDGALRLRALATGFDCVTGAALTGELAEAHRTLMESIAAVRATAKLGPIPTLIVHGRSDAIIAPNHSSRPYYALALSHGPQAPLRYYEVTNAHHLDAFNGFPGCAARYVPLHHYYVQAMDLMWAHLREGTALPPSQVVHTTPRRELTPPGEATVPIDAANASVILPPIAAEPLDEARIRFDGRVLFIPD